MDSLLTPSAAALLLALWPSTGPVTQDEPSAGSAVMMELASTCAEIERAFDEGDLTSVPAACDRTGVAAKHLRDLAGGGEENPLADGLGGYGPRLSQQAGELARFAREGDGPAAAEAFADLRNTCNACHLKYRPDDPVRGNYPARGGILAGSIKLLAVDGGEQRDRSGVVVFLEGAELGGPFAPPSRRPVVSQKGRVFTPRVLPVLRGATVVFPNDDTVFHNVFSLSRTKPFDLGIYQQGTDKSVTFTDAGLVRTYCNIHPQMLTNILVLENPFFALTDEDGFFAISGLPEGRFRLRVWHELGGDHEQEITISGSTVTRLSLSVQEERVSIAHKNKFGQTYRAKY